MQINKLTYVLMAWLFMGATCERPVDLQIEDPDARIVLSSAFTLGEKVKVSVSKTQSLFDYSPPEYLADAAVSLYQGNELIEELVLVVPSQERIRPYYTSVFFEPLSAITYTVKAEVSGFKDVFAHSFIPESVPISQLEISGLLESPGSETYRTLYEYDVLLNFEDPQKEDNYYHLNIFQELLEYHINEDGDTIINKTWQRAEIHVDSPDAVSDAMIGGVLLKNNPLEENGYNFHLGIEIAPEFQLIGKVFVELRTVSKEYYLFYSTFSRRQNQSNGPFSEPITVFNNIENGQGYFAGYSSIQDSISVGL